MRHLVHVMALAAGLPACGGSPPENQGYHVMSEHLQAFVQWPAFNLNDGQPELHRGFVNTLPPAGARTFAQGTIIIKTEETAPTAEGWHVYGMVKRGAGYNRAGALGWEWFELLPRRGGTRWEIRWRGVAPPDGATYRCVEALGPAAPDCNTCHASARANDYVMSEALSLQRLGS